MDQKVTRVDLNKLKILEKRLKKCPFCNGRAMILWERDYVSGRVVCSGCYAGTCGWATFELAVKHWNYRNNDKARMR